MDDHGDHLTTRTGFRFHVRPVRPADEGTIAEFFTHVTRDDLRFRYLTGLHEVGHARIAALANVDHKSTENFLAFTEDGGEMIATAMLACDAALDKGEVAIVIRNDYKEKGISWELLAHIARFAEAKGVKTLQSIESRSNHAAIGLERDMGFTASEYPGDPTLVLVTRTLNAV
ncbi:GNAT family N-acetyltransferase [soil metagenome]